MKTLTKPELAKIINAVLKNGIQAIMGEGEDTGNAHERYRLLVKQYLNA